MIKFKAGVLIQNGLQQHLQQAFLTLDSLSQVMKV